MPLVKDMTLEITLRVKGLEPLNDGSPNSPEWLLKFLQELEGILVARYDWENHRLALVYDPKKVTILGVLRRVELAGQRNGCTLRPTEVHSSKANACRWRDVSGMILPYTLVDLTSDHT